MASKQVLITSPHIFLKCPSIRAVNAAVRNFSSEVTKRHWKNDTPQGSLTEIYTYSPEDNSQTVWPDPTLGVFSQVDPKFCFPGNIGAVSDVLGPLPPEQSNLVHTAESTGEELLEFEKQNSKKGQSSDIFTRATALEIQAQTLYSANDFIQHTPGADHYVCADLLDAFPSLPGMKNMNLELHEAPTLLRKEIQGLFPETNTTAGNLSVMTMSQKTEHDMSAWSAGMEEERENLIREFISAAKEMCGKLKDDGYWADFIDPSSGRPYYGKHTNTTMYETDEKYRLLGFRIEDLGCCKVICHHEFGRNVFVGTVFTNAHAATGVIQDMFSDLQLELAKQTEL